MPNVKFRPITKLTITKALNDTRQEEKFVSTGKQNFIKSNWLRHETPNISIENMHLVTCSKVSGF